MANCPTCLHWKRKTYISGLCYFPKWHGQVMYTDDGCGDHQPKVIRVQRDVALRDGDAGVRTGAETSR